MLRTFTGFTRQMRKMAREFTDGMNKIADDADVADLKKAMDKAKSGDLDDLANAIDPGGDVSGSVRDLKDSLGTDAASDDLREIGKMADKAGRDIADDAASTDPLDGNVSSSPAKKAAKKKASKKKS